jgi:hypothetical protein
MRCPEHFATREASLCTSETLQFSSDYYDNFLETVSMVPRYLYLVQFNINLMEQEALLRS